MISSERADSLYMKMQEFQGSTFTSKDLDILSVALTSEVVLKAFGRAFSMIRALECEMAQLDMKNSDNLIVFCKSQGQIEGVKNLITGFLALITKEEEEESDDN